MKLLTKSSSSNHMKMQKSVLFVKKNLKINIWKIKSIWKLERSLSFYRGIGAAHSICNLKYSVPKIHPIVFHNGSNHDYHFIIKRSRRILKTIYLFRRKYRKVHSSYKNLEVKRIDKNGEEIRKNISYLRQFIDSARFMALSCQ